MANFAKLNENYEVLEVIGVNNNVLLDVNGNEKEELGVIFLIDWSGGHPYWKQTSYNANFRKNYAGYGYTYDRNRDAFIPPKPFSSWVLNESTCRWEAPLSYPQDGKMYDWNENNQTWDEVNW